MGRGRAGKSWGGFHQKGSGPHGPAGRKAGGPGGKREGNETDEETLIRECKEELDIDIKRDTIKYYGTFEAQAHGKAEGILVKMTCYMAEFEGNLKAS